MTIRSMQRMLWLLTLLAAGSLHGFAQAPGPQNVEVDPVTCWWRAGAASVRMGEPFAVLLTCSALEADAVRAVIDRSRLGPAAVQFPPYEVTGGAQSADYVTAGRRFLQYEYTLRLVTEDSFGVDVPVTGLEVSYRIESKVQQDGAVQGREQSYVLPPIPMRLASLVPDNAQGIREPPIPTLREIAEREFRARLFRIVALILFGVAALTLALALMRWFRQGRVAMPQVQRALLSNRAVIAGARRQLRDVQQEVRATGWTADGVARVLAATRLVASYAMGHPVATRRIDQDVARGEVVISAGWPSQRRVAACSATTAGELAGTDRAALAAVGLDEALTTLTTIRYGRNPDLDASALDDALDTVLRATDRVAARHTWVAEKTGALARSIRGWRPHAWAR